MEVKQTAIIFYADPDDLRGSVFSDSREDLHFQASPGVGVHAAPSRVLEVLDDGATSGMSFCLYSHSF